MNIDKLLKLAIDNKMNIEIEDEYKMKCLSWYQRLLNNISSWIITIIYLPKIIKVYMNGR